MQLRHGPPSRITAEAKESLGDWLRHQPDMTLAELRARLESVGVQVSRSRVSQLLQELGLRRKKNTSCSRTGYGRRPPSASGVVG